MAEFWDLYDGNGEKMGILHERGKEVPQGLYHLVVSVWIANEQGQYLMSQRHPDKPYPKCWECTGGSVLVGESSLQGAVREVAEELGLAVDILTAQKIYRTRRDKYQDFYEVWLFHSDVSVSSLKLQQNEVIAAQWMDNQEIQHLQKAGKLHPLLDFSIIENHQAI